MPASGQRGKVKSKKSIPAKFGTDAMTRKMFEETLRRTRMSRRLLDRTEAYRRPDRAKSN